MTKNSASDYTFQNVQRKEMTFNDVFDLIVSFMKKEPRGTFRLMLGTDSHVYPKETRFITGLVIQRKGKGAWACVRQVTVPRKMIHLHERISYETSLTEEMASLFTEERKNQLIDVVLPYLYQGASFSVEGHIDIGAEKRNKTSEFVREMVARIESMGMEPKIKPDAFVASAYADRYTKR